MKKGIIGKVYGVTILPETTEQWLELLDITKREEIEKYSNFLEKNGYMDSDWREEKPTAVERFLKEIK